MSDKKLTREEWERIAIADSIFHLLFDEWDARCRERSSTGENMVRENWDAHEYEQFKRDMYNRAKRLAVYR